MIPDGLFGFRHFFGDRLGFLFAPDFVRFFENELGRSFRALDHGRRLVLGVREDLSGFPRVFFDPAPGVFFLTFQVFPDQSGLLFLSFQFLAHVIQPADDVFEMDGVRVDQLLCAVDDGFRDTQFGRNCESVGFSGRSDDQPVCGLKRFDVELAGRVFHVIGIQCIRLQFGVMGRHGAERAAAAHVLEDGPGQRGSFDGIGTRTEFVQDDERVLVHRFEDGNDADHMRGERGKALLDALLVSDIAKDVFEHGDRRTFVRRDLQTGLRHQ